MNGPVTQIPADATPAAQGAFHQAVANRKARKNGKCKAAARPAPVTFRLTDDERRRLKELSGERSVSAYIRERLFGGKAARRKRVLRTPVRDQEALARLLAMLGASRIANNLNQLAYQANTGSLLIDEQTLSQIEDAYGHVCAMRALLLSTLGLADDEAP